MSARFLIASTQDSPEGAQVPIESVPVDGAVPTDDHVADQNAFLLIAFPVATPACSALDAPANGWPLM